MTAAPISHLYLSRLLLNPCSRQVMSELASPYEMHRTLLRAFPKATDQKEAKAREEFGVLFRAEVDEMQDGVKVYVQSRVAPNWSYLDEMNDYLCAVTGMPRDVMPAFRNIHSGQILSFRLRANPTKRIGKVTKGGPELKGKRVGLIRAEKQIDWLLGKGLVRENGKPGGFEIVKKLIAKSNGEIREVPKVNIRGEEKQRNRVEAEGRLHKTTHLAVLFEGVLRVTDKDAFLETLIRGIGPGKAFGFGLLSVAPA